MNQQLVFFIRNCPQGCDAIEIALKTNRTFIGYPAWRSGWRHPEKGFCQAIVDLSCSDADWEKEFPSLDVSSPKEVTKNRNLVRDAVPGSITLIPRPDHGAVYAGRVKCFELVDDPKWGPNYLALRNSQGLEVDPDNNHLADISQGWLVDRWREVPFSVIPAWIQKSFFGRATAGRIHPLSELGLDPFEVLDGLIDNPRRICNELSSDVTEVERRLVSNIGPGAFEHLTVALLQLEQLKRVWQHVGGSGDGGVDGVGSGLAGKVVAILQCKWKFDGGALDFETKPNDGIERYVATLVHPQNMATTSGTILWDRRRIAELVLKHAAKLPWAISMRVVS